VNHPEAELSKPPLVNLMSCKKRKGTLLIKCRSITAKVVKEKLRFINYLRERGKWNGGDLNPLKERKPSNVGLPRYDVVGDLSYKYQRGTPYTILSQNKKKGRHSRGKGWYYTKASIVQENVGSESKFKKKALGLYGKGTTAKPNQNGKKCLGMETRRTIKKALHAARPKRRTGGIR